MSDYPGNQFHAGTSRDQSVTRSHRRRHRLQYGEHSDSAGSSRTRRISVTSISTDDEADAKFNDYLKLCESDSDIDVELFGEKNFIRQASIVDQPGSAMVVSDDDEENDDCIIDLTDVRTFVLLAFERGGGRGFV